MLHEGFRPGCTVLGPLLVLVTRIILYYWKCSIFPVWACTASSAVLPGESGFLSILPKSTTYNQLGLDFEPMSFWLLAHPFLAQGGHLQTVI